MFRVLTIPVVPSHSGRPNEKSCERSTEVSKNVRIKKCSSQMLLKKSENIIDADIQSFTPSPPVIIPMPRLYNTQQKKRKASNRGGNCHRYDQINYPTNITSASPAKILALTSIPPWRKRGIQRHSARRSKFELSDDEGAVENDCEFGKKLYMSHGEHPLEILLSPPENDDDTTESDDSQGSFRSQSSCASFSCSSISSAGSTSTFKSLTSPILDDSDFASRPTDCLRVRRGLSVQKPTQCSADDHPLFVSVSDTEDHTYQETHNTNEITQVEPEPEHQNIQPRQLFKSNVSVSFQALKRVAKSISSFAAPVMIPDDFITRSIFHAGPKSKFSDKCMPLSLKNGPTSDLCLYLNSTTYAAFEARTLNSSPSLQNGKCTASIQMQTLKFSGSSRRSLSNRRIQFSRSDNSVDMMPVPLVRQREIRENSDFMRVAVIEMSMRKCGKLDDHKPGRARYVLPPRKLSMKPYAITEDGIPMRWIALTL